MRVIRYCCFAVGVLVTVGEANVVAQSEELPLQQSSIRRELARQEVIRQVELSVLRQKVSMPLDQLTQPVSLADWQKVAQIAPQISVHRAPSPQPHVEMPAAPKVVTDNSTEPASVLPSEAASNPFTDDPIAAEPGSKIKSGKLLGIVGRALLESAPVPSLDGLREHMPDMPIPAAGSAPPADADFGAAPATGEDPFGGDAGFAPVEESDPFSTEAAEPPAGGEAPATPAEDPFG